MIVDGIEVKTIPEFPAYAVSQDGRVWSNYRGGRWLKPSKAGKGYLCVNLFKSRKSFQKYIHHLVLETYVGFCPPGMECRHLDGKKQNCCLANLKWGTWGDNHEDAIKHGTIPSNQKGDSNFNAQLCEEQVRVIFHAYHDGYYSTHEIANIFGISCSLVQLIARKKRWRHLWIG